MSFISLAAKERIHKAIKNIFPHCAEYYSRKGLVDIVEIRQLMYLDAVYKYKNFTKASRALYVSQPTISAAIKSLESEFGFTLIERTSHGLVFTPDGEVIMKRIQMALSDYNDILAEADEISHRSNYTLRLGIASILSTDIFPLIYKDFLLKHPDLTVRLDEDSAHGHINKLLNEDLDLALNGVPEDLDTGVLEALPVGRREIKLIMHRDHPLAALESVPIERLDGEDVSIFSPSGVMGTVLERALSEHGVRPNVISEHSQIHGMLEIISTCCGVGFLNFAPEATEMSREKDLVLRSFSEPLSFTIGFMMKKRRYIAPACREFIAFITEKLGGAGQG